jgi:hypothetical protein
MEITSLTLGEPRVVGPLAVFPVFGPQPTLAYRSFVQATALGAFVKELEGGASVNDLLVENKTDLPVLLYEGEEVLGAQQNRTFDLSLLIAARSRATIPVSCVERGRWDGRRHAESFSPSPQAAHPRLRRSKRTHVNAAVAAGAPARADQGAVWRAVANDLSDEDVASGTGAMHDLYDAKRDELRALGADMEPVSGQLGALAAVSGRPVALDSVSRPDVFASLLPRLAQGYALDALGAEPADPDRHRAQAFVDRTLAARRAPTASTPGLGTGFALSGDGIVGGGLAHEDELVAISVFPDAGSAEHDAPTPHGHIARPSRRRRGRA